MPTTLDVLMAARKLIEKPEHWCQGTYAAGADGQSAAHTGEPVVAYCCAGAIDRCGLEINDGDLPWAARQALSDAMDEPDGVICFNDARGRTHDEVLALFDRAIEAERAKVVS